MKNLTNLELLMEYMEQNQYFIGNDLLEKYNELLQKEKKEQLALTDVSQHRELLIAFDTMREFDIKHDDIEESIDYFLKNKESYL